MKMSTITVGAGASIGTRSIILYDTIIGEQASLSPLSLLMKGEELPPKTSWRGIPAEGIRADTTPSPAARTTIHPDATATDVAEGVPA